MLVSYISKNENSYKFFLPKGDHNGEEGEFEKDKLCFLDVLLY